MASPAPPSPAPPSTELSARLSAITAELGEPITLDGLTRDFVLFQRRRGHRFSTDDLLTAWYAVTHAPPSPATLLDLGSGIGSVGLSVLWRFPEARLTAVEVQAQSFRLLRENVEANGVADRVRAVHGDLRDAVPREVFDLVTGSPPYFGRASGIVSADPQRAAARFELHGDVTDYARAARSALAPGGRFVFCFPTAQRSRAEAACEAAGLVLVASRDVVPRDGLPPLFSLFACSSDRRTGRVDEPPLVVRDAAGGHTPDLASARALFGMA